MNAGYLRYQSPRKNPYFLLPDSRHLQRGTPPNTVKPYAEPAAGTRDRVEPPFKQSISVAALFGKVSNMSSEKQAEFLLQLMLHSNFQPDFQKMAEFFNIAGGIAVQRRFVAIAKRNGFSFKNGKISRMNDSAAVDKVTLGLVRSRGGNGAGAELKAGTIDAESENNPKSTPKAPKKRKHVSATEENSESTLISDAVADPHKVLRVSQADPEANSGDESNNVGTTRAESQASE